MRLQRSGGPEPHAAKDGRIAAATRAGHIPAASTIKRNASLVEAFRLTMR